MEGYDPDVFFQLDDWLDMLSNAIAETSGVDFYLDADKYDGDEFIKACFSISKLDGNGRSVNITVFFEEGMNFNGLTLEEMADKFIALQAKIGTTKDLFIKD